MRCIEEPRHTPGFATAIPKNADGTTVEIIWQLKVAHDIAFTGRAATMVTLKSMLVRAPEHIRWETIGMTPIKLTRHLAEVRLRQLKNQTAPFVTHCALSLNGGRSLTQKPRNFLP